MRIIWQEPHTVLDFYILQTIERLGSEHLSPSRHQRLMEDLSVANKIESTQEENAVKRLRETFLFHP